MIMVIYGGLFSLTRFTVIVCYILLAVIVCAFILWCYLCGLFSLTRCAVIMLFYYKHLLYVGYFWDVILTPACFMASRFTCQWRTLSPQSCLEKNNNSSSGGTFGCLYWFRFDLEIYSLYFGVELDLLTLAERACWLSFVFFKFNRRLFCGDMACILYWNISV